MFRLKMTTKLSASQSLVSVVRIAGVFIALLGCNSLLDNPKGHLVNAVASGAAGSGNTAGAAVTSSGGSGPTSSAAGASAAGAAGVGPSTGVTQTGATGGAIHVPEFSKSSGGSSHEEPRPTTEFGGEAGRTTTSSQGGAEPTTQSATSAGGPSAGSASTGGSQAQGGTSQISPRTPRIVRVEPIDGTRGVAADSAIVVRFSEPMDTFSVASALSVTDLEASKRTLIWNEALDTLTIKANDGFSYATGTDTAFAAKAYTVSVAASARSMVGNRLDADFSSGFYTLRRITQTIAATGVYLVNTYATSAYGYEPEFCNIGLGSVGKVTVGYMATAKIEQRLVYATFNLDVMAAPAAVEQALLCAVQGEESGSFYLQGGKIFLSKLAYQFIDKTILSAAVEKAEGWLSTSGSEGKPKLSIKEYFQNDVMTGKKNLLYRLTPELSVADTYAQFECGGFAIQTTYLAK